jgi:hypothetical protein
MNAPLTPRSPTSPSPRLRLSYAHISIAESSRG